MQLSAQGRSGGLSRPRGNFDPDELRCIELYGDAIGEELDGMF